MEDLRSIFSFDESRVHRGWETHMAKYTSMHWKHVLPPRF